MGRRWRMGDRQALTVPSARAEITFPRADSDLLIFFASSRTAPSAPVLLTCRRRRRTKQVCQEGGDWPPPLHLEKEGEKERGIKREKLGPFLRSPEPSC